MLILLPPSETKASGGDGVPLTLSTLSFPSLNEVRREIIADLCSLDVEDSLKVLGISEALRAEAEANQNLYNSPTMPAVLRYTGVLYDALDAKTLTSLDPHALSRLAIGSALFGVLRAQDPIPQYRLSSGTKLPQRIGADTCEKREGPLPTLQRRWGSHITEALAATADANGQGVVVDLRSGGYQNLGKVLTSSPGSDAVTVRVESTRPDGTRKVVSHFNKHYKGILARTLATAGSKADAARTTEDIAAIAESAGLHVEINSAAHATRPKDTLTLVV